MNPTPVSTNAPTPTPHGESHHLRFHQPHRHLHSLFGDDWFALKAEAFARFFGTPLFLVGQTCIVALWIGLNIAGVVSFDLFPFILLNLAFSLQSAYAAPLILLAQTRQSDRDKALSDADAQHREDLAQAAQQRIEIATQQGEQLLELLRLNTELTESTKKLTLQIESLTRDLHGRTFQSKP